MDVEMTPLEDSERHSESEFSNFGVQGLILLKQQIVPIYGGAAVGGGKMKDLLASVKKVFLQAALAVFLCGIGVFAQGKLHLIVPVIVGCIIGAACWLVIGYRIFKSSDLDVEAAKKSMRFGWLIRLSLILVTLIAAVRISTEVFWSVVIGLFLMSVILMVNAMVYAYKCNADKKK